MAKIESFGDGYDVVQPTQPLKITPPADDGYEIVDPRTARSKAEQRRDLRNSLYQSALKDNLARNEPRLSPAQEMELDSLVDQKIPVTQGERDFEIRLKADPKWNPYNPGKPTLFTDKILEARDIVKETQTGGGIWTPPEVGGLGGGPGMGGSGVEDMININSAFQEAPKPVKDLVTGFSMGYMYFPENAVGSVGGLIMSAARGIGWGAHRGLSMIAGENFANSKFMFLKNNFITHGQQAWEQFFNERQAARDMTIMSSDPNRPMKVSKDPLTHKLVYEYDNSDPNLAPAGMFSPISVGNFLGDMTAQFLATGLVGKALEGMSLVMKAKDAKKILTVEEKLKDLKDTQKFVQRGTTGVLTMIQTGQTQRELKQGLMDKGLNEEDAQQLSFFGALAAAPLMYKAEQLDVGARLASGKKIAEEFPKWYQGWVGHTIAGAVGEGIEEGTQESVTELLKHTYGLREQNSYGLTESLKQIGTAFTFGAFGGAWMGSLERSMQMFRTFDRAHFVNDMLSRGRNPDAWSKRAIYAQGLMDFSLKVGMAKDFSELVNVLQEAKAQREKKTLEQTYGEVYAGMQERNSIPLPKAGDPYSELGWLFQEQDTENVARFYQRSREAVWDEKFMQQFKRGADPLDIRNYLMANGLGTLVKGEDGKSQWKPGEEYFWSGLENFLEPLIQENAQRKQRGEETSKIRPEELQHVVAATGFGVVSRHWSDKKAPEIKQLTALNQEWDNSHRQMYDINDMMYKLEVQKSNAYADWQKVKELNAQIEQYAAAKQKITDRVNEINRELGQLELNGIAMRSSGRAHFGRTGQADISLLARNLGELADYHEWTLAIPRGYEHPPEFAPMKGTAHTYFGQKASDLTLLHVRVQEYNHPQHGRIMVVNEIQSPQMQEIQYTGHKGNESGTVPARQHSMQKKVDEFYSQVRRIEAGEQLSAEELKRHPELLEDVRKEFNTSFPEGQMAEEHIRATMQFQQDRQHPFPLFTKWVDVGIKKILIEAINRGITKVAFPTGESMLNIQRWEAYRDSQANEVKGATTFYEGKVLNTLKQILKSLGWKGSQLDTLAVEGVSRKGDEEDVAGNLRAMGYTEMYHYIDSHPNEFDINEGNIKTWASFREKSMMLADEEAQLMDARQEQIDHAKQVLVDNFDTPGLHRNYASDISFIVIHEAQHILKSKNQEEAVKTSLMNHGFPDRVIPPLVKPILEAVNYSIPIENVQARMDTHHIEYREFAEKHIKKVAIEGKQSYQFPMVEITPTMADKAKAEGFWLFQDRKGAVAFLNNGKAIVRALQNPDITTSVHELGHIIRRSFLSAADLARVEKLFGVKEGKWTREQDEQFARTFEAYIKGTPGSLRGIPSNAVDVMSKMSDWMKTIYIGSKRVDGALKVNTELEGVFRRLFLEDTQPITAQEEKVKGLETAVDGAKKNLKNLEKSVQDQAEIAADAALTEEIKKKETALRQEFAAQKREVIKQKDVLEQQKYDLPEWKAFDEARKAGKPRDVVNQLLEKYRAAKEGIQQKINDLMNKLISKNAAIAAIKRQFAGDSLKTFRSGDAKGNAGTFYGTNKKDLEESISSRDKMTEAELPTKGKGVVYFYSGDHEGGFSGGPVAEIIHEFPITNDILAMLHGKRLKSWNSLWVQDAVFSLMMKRAGAEVVHILNVGGDVVSIDLRQHTEQDLIKALNNLLENGKPGVDADGTETEDPVKLFKHGGTKNPTLADLKKVPSAVPDIGAVEIPGLQKATRKELVQKHVGEFKTNPDYGYEATKRKLQEAHDSLVNDYRNEKIKLRNLIEGYFQAGPMHRLEEIEPELAWIRGLAEGNQVYDQRSLLNKSFGWLNYLYDIGRQVQNTPVGKWFVARAEIAGDTMKRLMSKHTGDIYNLFTKVLSDKAIKWMNQIEPGHNMPNWVRMLDSKGTRQNSRIDISKVTALSDIEKAGLTTLFRNLFDSTSDEMTRLRTLRQLPSGDHAPFQESMEYTLPLLMTEEGYSALRIPTHPARIAYEAIMSKWYPDATIEDIRADLDNHLKMTEASDATEAFTRRAGMIEGSRRFPYRPWVVDFSSVTNELLDKIGISEKSWINALTGYQLNKKRQMNLFHSNPVELFQVWNANISRRLGLIEVFGNSVLKDVYDNAGTMRRILQLFGVRSHMLKEELAQKVRSLGLVDMALDTNKLTYKELVELCKDNGFEPGFEIPELLAMIHGLTPRQLTEGWFLENRKLSDAKDDAEKQFLIKENAKLISKRMTQLKNLIQSRVKGIDTQQEFQAVLWDLKQRATEKIIDNGLELAEKAYINQGGRIEDFTRVKNAAQGRPMYNTEANGLVREVMNIQKVFNTLLTTASTVPNMSQTLIAATLMGPRGLMYELRALATLAQDYTSVRKDAIDLGVLIPTMIKMTSDKSHWTSRLVDNIATVASEAFLARRTGEFNDLMVFQLAKQLVESWQQGTFGKGINGVFDEGLVKLMRLDDKDVAAIKAGLIDQKLFQKIVQRWPAVTQGKADLNIHKGMLELHPVLRTTFALQSYSALMTRILRAYTGMFFEHAPVMWGGEGDWKKLGAGFMSLLALVAGAWGAGRLTRILRSALTGRPVKPSKSRLEAMKEDVQESMAFGFYTKLLGVGDNPGPWVYKQPLTVLNPSMGSVVELIRMYLHADRYREFSATRRGYEFIKSATPIVKAFDRQIEYLAYPAHKQYDEKRTRYFNWMRQQAWYDPAASDFNTAMNPNYEEIHQWIIRGENDKAHAAIKNYVGAAPQLYQEQGRDPTKILTNLRASLLAKRPIPVQGYRRRKFLESLSREERRAYIEADLKYEFYAKALTGGLIR